SRRPSRLFLMAWDGMRPDLISPDLTPNLAKLCAEGTVFDAHHAVVPTVTRINTATLATGAPSSVHGLPANGFFAAAVEPDAMISIGEGDSVARLQQAYGVFAAPTISDVAGQGGGRTAIVSSGTRGSSQMLHPRRLEAGDYILHPTLSTPDEVWPVAELLGPMPQAAVPDTARNRWLAEAIAQVIVPRQHPDILYFWHDDPDKSQHLYGFGHPISLQAIRDADTHLGIVLDGLSAAGLRDETLVVVASDHGYVNVTHRPNFGDALRAALPDIKVRVAPNGGSALLYLDEPTERLTALVASALLPLPGVDVVFTGSRGAATVDGTLPLSSLEMDGPLAPDLLVTLRWSDGETEHGHRGLGGVYASSNNGSHGGASSWEIHNTLVMHGPGIRSGLHSASPSGIGDIAPTVLTALGLTVPSSMSGRVLHEALVSGSPAAGAVERWDEAAEHGTMRWTRYGGRSYLDAVSRLGL
ncbi:MAG: alkaline phosphatase family protein, partial [Chloroflexota bacterium]